MGKANRLKTEKAENTLTSSLHKKTEKKGMPTWLGTAIVIVVLAALLLTAVFFALNSAGTFNRLRVVMATDNFEVTVPMMSYMVYTEYQELVATYDNYSSQFGITISIPAGKGGTTLDKNKPLRDQYYATQDESGLTLETPETWFDHFASQAMTDVKKMLVVCEAAKAAGIELESGDLESIDMAVAYLSLYASYYGYTTNGYIAAMYGDGVNIDDVRAMMEISALADKYNQQRSEEFTAGITDDQVQNEYDTNKDKYDVFVDYIAYTFSASFTASTNKDAETAKQENIANAEKYEAKKAKYKALMEELKEAAETAPDTYAQKLLEVLKELYFEEEKDAALAKKASGETLSDAEIETCRTSADKKAEEAIANAIKKNVDTSDSSMDTALKAWLTDKNAPVKAGDVYTSVKDYDAFNKEVTEKPEGEETEGEETEGGAEAQADEKKDYADSTSSYSVYLLNTGLKRNDGYLRSVGHILFKTDSFQDKDGKQLTSSSSFSGVMKTLADRVLAKNSELTAELMAKELLALMKEEGKLIEKTENGKTFYWMEEAVFETYGGQYTADSNVVYDNVKEGQMVKPFENWLFDDSRVEGEVSYPDAVKTDYGYHIMLYRGDEKPAWSYSIRVSLAEGQYDAWLEQLLKDTHFEKENADHLRHIAG